ncbi:MAG TPA: response regulator [Syntrophomonadaceae bacterium]|nr:response regulator [Syntrophomonadaceae bacterium]
MNILLVDDDSSRWVIATFLREGGYQVTVCSNAFDALDQLAARDFDLMITDINMPDMSGVELLKKLRLIPGKADIEVIVCTGDSGKKSVKEAGKYEVHTVLMKPIQVDEFMKIIGGIEEQVKSARGKATGS